MRQTREVEEWRQIDGYNGVYEVSNYGNIRRSGSFSKVYKNRQLKPTYNMYLRIGLSKHGTVKTCYVHRLVAAAFIGECPEGKEVNHKDGIRTNNSVKNLEYVSSRENTIHGLDNGAIPSGENHYASKLSNNEVVEIKALRKDGKSAKFLSKKFGVCEGHICSIIAGRRRKRG